MNQCEKMSPEKSSTTALYATKLPFDDEISKKKKYCSKTLWTCILAVILVSLCIVLTVEFLYPVEIRYKQDIDELRFFGGKHNSNPVDTDKGPWHLDFLINPTRLCETVNPPESEVYQKDPEVKLLMLVPSATSHFAERRAIRRTWGSVAQEPQGPFRLGFVLGTTSNSTETELIEKESVAFGDIIQADFQDTYRNLTTKSVMMLKWVSRHCAHAQYFLKADDDTFVNLHLIAQILQKDPYQSSDKFISGFIHRGAQPYRGPDEKYYVSEEEFPDDKYPPYASGSAYMSTGSTAAQLYEASKSAKPFVSLEDVFITGLCADDIDAMLFHEPSFLYKEPPRPIAWDSYKPLATAHSVSPDDMEEIWTEMTKIILDSVGFSDLDSFFNFPDMLSSLSDDSSLSDLLIFPNRNTGRGLFDLPSNDAIAQLLNLPSEKSFSSSVSSSSSSLNDKTPRISPSSVLSGIFKFPETEVFNITFFLRK